MKNLTTATLLALTSTSALAAPENTRLEETIISSSRVAMPLREVATSVSVVSKEDIDIRGFSSVADILRYEPSISVVNNGGPGKTTELGIRGERGYRTKVYIDGMDVTDTSTPQAGPNFANMSSAGVERIEILRGPQGLIYGADAGGVVSISTQKAEPGFGGAAGVEYGRYGTHQYEASVWGGNETLDFSVLGSQYETDGFNSLTSDLPPQDEDGYENETFHARLGWNITEALHAELVGRKVDGDNEYDSCGLPVTFDPTDACTNEYEQEAWRAALLYQGAVFSNSISFNQTSSDREFFSEGLSTFATQGELEKIEYLGTWNPNKQTSLVYGAELISESIEDGADNPDRDQDGVFLEYQGSFNENLYVTVGARYDDNDDFGSETTYRTSAAYLIPVTDGEYKIKGSFGSGFRAPSLSEIAYNNSFSAYPPASLVELAAEKSEGYEAGVAYFASSGWYVEAIYFDQSTEDEIFFDLVDFSGYLQGDGDSTSTGLELIGELPLSETIALTGNYTYNDTEDSDGVQRLRAPENKANLGVRFTPMHGRLVVNLNARFSRDSSDEQSGAVDDYETVDLSVSYQILETLEVYGRVENLLDEEYQEIPNYNGSGAAGYAGVRVSF